MENVIMTGATGEIGLALVKELLSAGKNVTVIARPNSKRIGRLPQNDNLHIIECKLENLSELQNCGSISGIFDAFYHLGWDYSRDHNNVDKQLLNIGYTMDAVNTAAKLGCSCFIGAGSQAEYGRAEGKISEMTSCVPETAYGIAKYCAGRMAELLCEQKGIRYVWPRIFSIYGPGDAESTMVMSVIRQLLAGKEPDLTKGEQMWDFLYTSDCARALRLLWENSVCEGVYCIGSGTAKPLRSYIEKIRDNISEELLLGFGKLPYSDRQVMNLSVNIDRLTKDTGFKPNIMFDEGIRETIEWCREHHRVEKTGYGA